MDYDRWRHWRRSFRKALVTKLRAVLFDMAGTLVSISVFRDHNAVVRDEFVRLAQIKNATPADIQKALVVATSAVTPKITRRSFYRYHELTAARYAAAANILNATLATADADRVASLWWERCVEHFRCLMATGDGLRPGAVETIRAIKDAGLHVGLVSNIDKHILAAFLDIGDWGSFFDSSISSECAGSCKPDPKIFRMALKQAGCKSAEALFVGDTPSQDIVGAFAVGMRSALIRREECGLPNANLVAPRADHEISQLAELISLLRVYNDGVNVLEKCIEPKGPVVV